MDELEQLQSQIKEMQDKADALLAQRKGAVIAEVKAKILSYGITAKDLGFGSVSFVKPALEAKYRLNDQTWSGRGKRPRFITQYLESGGKLEDLAV